MRLICTIMDNLSLFH